MSYSVQENDAGAYDIIEKDSGVTIALSKTETCVRPICRKLNLGGGFNGWTPLFFAKRC